MYLLTYLKSSESKPPSIPQILCEAHYCLTLVVIGPIAGSKWPACYVDDQSRELMADLPRSGVDVTSACYRSRI